MVLLGLTIGVSGRLMTVERADEGVELELDPRAKNGFSHPSPRRTLASTRGSPPIWVLVTIPLVAAIVGWGTNVVALKMTFHPLKFWPECFAFSQFKNQPIGWLPGWQVKHLSSFHIFTMMADGGMITSPIPASSFLSLQGIIPAKAPIMVAKLTVLMSTKIIDVQEVFRRIKPEKMAVLVQPGVYDSTRRAVEYVALKEFPGIWYGLSNPIRDELASLLSQDVNVLIKLFVDELRENFFDGT